MVWIFRILIGAILALMCGCMLGALVLIIEEHHESRRRHKRTLEAIERMEKGAQHVGSKSEN